MLDLHPYLIALAATSAFCLWAFIVTRSEALVRCLAAVIVVWCISYAYGALTGDFTHWEANMVIDGGTAAIILRHPAGKMQAALGGTYAVQVAMHLSYGARELWSVPDPVAYYEMLTLVAYAQLAILGGWSGAAWGHFALDFRGRLRAAMDYRKGHRRLGIKQ